MLPPFKSCLVCSDSPLFVPSSGKFALLGMQLFGGQYNETTGYGPPPLTPVPRYNFDYFVPAMLTCFVLATGGW